MTLSERDQRHETPQPEHFGTPGEHPLKEEESAGREGKVGRILGATPVMMSVVLLLLVVTAVLSWYAMQWKQRVTVNRLIVTGTSLLSAADLEKALVGFRGRSIDEVRVDDVRRVLASEPYIRNMEVNRELNGILRVSITERRPAALLIEAEQSRIIDTEGNLLPDYGISARFRRLVTVYGADSAPSGVLGVRRMHTGDRELLFLLLDAFARSEHAGLMLSQIHLASENATWFTVAGSPIRFVLGNDGNFKEKLKKFEIFWQKVVAKKGMDCYESVDLRFRNRVFARESTPEVDPALPVPPVAAPEGSQLYDEHH
ncbi:MAG: FtsQ-type POTRA domain-containing protein [Chlorobiaceae bacterium]|nr:FtsQ-type POTRA domain-containing protein [Chlorobiaceae bacterium]